MERRGRRIRWLLVGMLLLGAGFSIPALAGSGPFFSDVPLAHWAARSIESLAQRGIIRGYPDGSFRPDQYVTRAELAEALARIQAAPNIMQAPHTEWNQDLPSPRIHREAFVSPGATVVGDVTVERLVFVAPEASVRGDEGRPVVIGAGSNVQDGAIIHGLENSHSPENRYQGPDGRLYSVYVGRNVSLAHGAIVHGPAVVGDDVFLGFRAIVLKARLGPGVFVGHGAMVMGVTVAPNRYVPSGAVIDTQEQADALPMKTAAHAAFAAEVIHVNQAFARGYRQGPAGPAGGH